MIFDEASEFTPENWDALKRLVEARRTLGRSVKFRNAGMLEPELDMIREPTPTWAHPVYHPED